MTYKRDYVEEQVNILKARFGDRFKHVNEDDIRKSIKESITEEELNKLNSAVLVPYPNGKTSCSLKLNSQHIGSCGYGELEYVSELLDEHILNEFTLEDALDEFWSENPINKNISRGMKQSKIEKIIREFQELCCNNGVDIQDVMKNLH